jgi:hypothetical protein
MFMEMLSDGQYEKEIEVSSTIAGTLGGITKHRSCTQYFGSLCHYQELQLKTPGFCDPRMNFISVLLTMH